MRRLEYLTSPTRTKAFFCTAATVLFLLSWNSAAVSQISVLTQHYDNARTGQNTRETILTPANVNAVQFGKLFTQSLDGQMPAQPLYVPNVFIPATNSTHNAMYAVTMHDGIYAFDADNNQGSNASPLWYVSLLTNGATTVPQSDQGCSIDYTEFGIQGTPVIDTTLHAIFFLAMTVENGSYVHRLHALDLGTGEELFGGPVVIAASVVVDGLTYPFVDHYQQQRPGLLLQNGTIYIGFGSPGCNIPTEMGWVMAYNEQTLQQVGVFDTSPGVEASAVWLSGGGLAGDGAGNIYFSTGDGLFDGPGGTHYGDSVIELNQGDGVLNLVSSFTPYNQKFFQENDLDVSSGLVQLLPQQPDGSNFVLSIDKNGTTYLLNQNSLGGYNSLSDTQIPQELDVPVNGEVHAGLTYWNNNIYIAAYQTRVAAYSFANDQISLTPTSQTPASTANPQGGIVSSSGQTNGIYWYVTVPTAHLLAFDATNLANQFYSSTTAANNRDALGSVVHFEMPVVANGKVYVNGKTQLTVYGLLPIITATAGNNQSGLVGTTLPIALQTALQDPYSGNPIQTSGIPITFTANNKTGSFSNPSAVTGSTGTASTSYTLPPKAATVTITASSPGYASATFVVTSTSTGQTGQTITFTTPAPASAANGSNFTVAATASSGLTVAYTSSGSCSNSGATYTMTSGTGTCSVIANQAGNSSYAAAPQVTDTVTATPLGQTITFTIQAPASAANGSNFTVAATASSGLTVAYTSSGSCSNAGATYTMTSGTGTCSVIANQAGNANYAAAPRVTETVNAASGSQTITFTTPAPTSAANGSNFTVAATASSGLTVAYTSSGSCSNSGATYTMTSGTGTCSVIANQPGNSNYAAAPQVTETVAATPGSQTITFTTLAPNSAANGSNFTVAATASSGLTVTFSSAGSCSNSGATYTMTSGTGTCSVIANQPGNANYAAAPQVTETVIAAAGSQTITFTTPAPSSAANGSNFTVAATASSGLTVTFSSAGSCSNSGATYTITSGTGTCSVIANQAGNSNYATTQATETVTATPASQTITFTTPAPASAAYGSNFTVAATASSGLTVAYTSSGSCSNSGATYTMTSGTGTCSVIANQAGNGNYAAATPVTETVTASLTSQTITFTTPAPASATYGNNFTVAATASSGLTVTFSGSGSCSNSGATYTMTSGTGTCSVTANQPGDGINYAAATPVTETVNAALASQTITVTTPAPASATYGSNFTVAANASSGLGVSYTSSGSCSNSGATYTMTSGTGTCSVVASQAGNSNYSAATPVTETVNATPGNQTITFTTPAPASAAYGSNFTVAASASSGLPVNFSSAGSCSNSGATYTTTSGTGTCSVTANAAGNGNYSAATPVTETVTAAPASQTITFTTPAPASAAYLSNFTVAASASSGLSVAYSSSGSCANSGATYTMTSGSGTCSVTANAAGNGNYSAAAPATETVAAVPLSQAIMFSVPPPATSRRNDTFTVVATGGASGNPVSFAAGVGSVCTISGATFTMTGNTGFCYVVANQAGNSNYSAAPQLIVPVTAVATVTKVAPTVTFTGAPASAAYVSTFTVATTQNSGVTPTIMSTTASVCTVAGNLVTMKSGTGTCTVKAAWATNDYYLAASLTQSVTATPLATTTTITNAVPETNPLKVTVYFAVSNGMNTVTGDVTVTAATGQTCTGMLSAGSCTLKFSNPGPTTLTAAYAGNPSNTTSTSASYPLTVN